MRPDERAAFLCNHANFFCKDRDKAKELALLICEIVMNDRGGEEKAHYWKLVIEEIYKL
ncbi:hypothetical protein [Flavobacterium sp.]|jgi:hypothetical protein|uniref:hypothetical protein n=1 Tax=Flavobacterium sp. TaxID=239 RepID=UPI0037BE3E5F